MIIQLPNYTDCQTSGYGYSQYVLGNPAVIAPTLQWTDMKCITTAECKKTWRLQTLTSRQQCAEQDNATSCMGDSGMYSLKTYANINAILKTLPHFLEFSTVSFFKFK